jgi:hypothetical protein
VTVRIRPHHLLCLLTFAGEFFFGPDDICAPLLGDPECHCREGTVLERDRRAADALSSLLKQPIRENASIQLNAETLNRMRKAFAAGEIRQACNGCQWAPLCDKIADRGFHQTRLLCGTPARGGKE